MIGVAVTCYNRPEIAKKTIDEIIRLTPDAKIVIVDGVEGIAKAKNECLRLLEGCEELFLFDEDCYPIRQYWWHPYISSGEPHLNFTFSHLHNGATNGNRTLIKSVRGLNVFQNPCGCMMYLNRKCLDAVGGFDQRYDVYAYEHVDLSVRIHNAGLTTYAFMDIQDSLKYFYSHDYYQTAKSSLEPLIRGRSIRYNRPIFTQMVESKSKEFIPYK